MGTYIPLDLFGELASFQRDVGDIVTFERHRNYVAPDVDFLFLCFTNRSGSTYLSELLATTNGFCISHEMLNADVLIEWGARHKHGHIGEYLSQVAAEQAWDGCFAVKASISQIWIPSGRWCTRLLAAEISVHRCRARGQGCASYIVAGRPAPWGVHQLRPCEVDSADV